MSEMIEFHQNHKFCVHAPNFVKSTEGLIKRHAFETWGADLSQSDDLDQIHDFEEMRPETRKQKPETGNQAPNFQKASAEPARPKTKPYFPQAQT